MSQQQFYETVQRQEEYEMTTYAELRKINVNDFTEKKGQLTYLSWTWAVDQLLMQDPQAVWEFPEPKVYNDTMMVFCNVTALGKTMRMQLPVMDNRNNAITNPDARKISDATMRCLAKCIACFGIGLYIFAGEDLPQVDIDTDTILADLGKAKDKAALTVAYKKAMNACQGNKQAEALVIARAKEVASLFEE